MLATRSLVNSLAGSHSPWIHMPSALRQARRLWWNQIARPSRLKFARIALLSALVLAVAANFLQYEVRSYVFLLQFLDPHADGFLVRLEGHDFDVQDVAFNTAQGPARARLYAPRGIAHPPGMVLVHGIHHLGIDEPRLSEFCTRSGEQWILCPNPGNRGACGLSRRCRVNRDDR